MVFDEGSKVKDSQPFSLGLKGVSHLTALGSPSPPTIPHSLMEESSSSYPAVLDLLPISSMNLLKDWDSVLFGYES